MLRENRTDGRIQWIGRRITVVSARSHHFVCVRDTDYIHDNTYVWYCVGGVCEHGENKKHLKKVNFFTDIEQIRFMRLVFFLSISIMLYNIFADLETDRNKNAEEEEEESKQNS